MSEGRERRSEGIGQGSPVKFALVKQKKTGLTGQLGASTPKVDREFVKIK